MVQSLVDYEVKRVQQETKMSELEEQKRNFEIKTESLKTEIKEPLPEHETIDMEDVMEEKPDINDIKKEGNVIDVSKNDSEDDQDETPGNNTTGIKNMGDVLYNMPPASNIHQFPDVGLQQSVMTQNVAGNDYYDVDSRSPPAHFSEEDYGEDSRIEEASGSPIAHFSGAFNQNVMHASFGGDDRFHDGSRSLALGALGYDQNRYDQVYNDDARINVMPQSQLPGIGYHQTIIPKDYRSDIHFNGNAGNQIPRFSVGDYHLDSGNLNFGGNMNIPESIRNQAPMYRYPQSDFLHPLPSLFEPPQIQGLGSGASLPPNSMTAYKSEMQREAYSNREYAEYLAGNSNFNAAGFSAIPNRPEYNMLSKPETGRELAERLPPRCSTPRPAFNLPPSFLPPNFSQSFNHALGGYNIDSSFKSAVEVSAGLQFPSMVCGDRLNLTSNKPKRYEPEAVNVSRLDRQLGIHIQKKHKCVAKKQKSIMGHMIRTMRNTKNDEIIGLISGLNINSTSTFEHRNALPQTHVVSEQSPTSAVGNPSVSVPGPDKQSRCRRKRDRIIESSMMSLRPSEVVDFVDLTEENMSAEDDDL